MNTAAPSLLSGARTRQPFYLVMSIALGTIAVLGFSKTIPGDLQVVGFPPLLWLHAAAFSAWVLLFVAQPLLVINGLVRSHRWLGWAGALLACAMVVLGAMAILMGLWADAVPPFYPHGLFLIRGAIGLLLFAGFVAVGAQRRRQPGWHKRLMLFASIIVVIPGLVRAMPLYLFGANWPFVVDGLVDLIACAGPAADLLYERRVPPAYLCGLAAIVLGQVLTYLLAPSHLAIALLHALNTS